MLCLVVELPPSLTAHVLKKGHKFQSCEIFFMELIPECQVGPSQYPQDLLPTSSLASP